MRSGERGLGYFGLLALLALLGAALAEVGTAHGVQAQRQREAELRFRGEQIRAAIERYRAARSPAEWPPTLEALLDDRRDGVAGTPRHHLRRLWTDPFTGQPDWTLLPAPAPDTGIAGVASRAATRRLAEHGTPARSADGVPRVSDWRFEHPAAAAPAPTRPTTTTHEPTTAPTNAPTNRGGAP